MARRGAGRGLRACCSPAPPVRSQPLSASLSQRRRRRSRAACWSLAPTPKPPATRTTAPRVSTIRLLDRAARRCRASSRPASRCIRRSATATAPGRRASASTARRVAARASRLVYFNTVSPDFFRTTGMTCCVAGTFGDDDQRTRRASSIVNETLARRFFPGQDPARTPASPSGGTRTAQDLEIVGLVSRRQVSAAAGDCASIAYLPWLQQRGGNMFVELRAAGR